MYRKPEIELVRVQQERILLTGSDEDDGPIPVKGLHQGTKTYYVQAEPLGWTYTKMRLLRGGSKDGRRVKIILEQTIGPKKRASFIVGQNFIEGDGYTMLYQWGRKDPFPSQDIAATNGIVR